MFKNDIEAELDSFLAKIKQFVKIKQIEIKESIKLDYLKY